MQDSPHDILSIVDRLTFFSAFSADEKRQIVSDDARVRIYHPGQLLIRKSHSGRNLFIILSGTVTVQGINDTVLAVLKPGDILGEMAFFTGTPRTANVVAREAVIALKLGRAVFDQLPARIREKFKDRIIHKLVARLDTANTEFTRLNAAVEQAPPDVRPLAGPAAGPLTADTAEPVFLSGRELIRKIIADTDALPAMPEVMIKVQRAVKLPGTTPAQLAKIIESEPSLVAGILKVANSAYYGFRGKVSTVQHASTLFGTRRLAELITAMSADGVLGAAIDGYALRSGDMWRHAVAVAFTAAEVAAVIDADLSQSAYMAGLLHDIGKLVLNPYVRRRKLLFDHYRDSNPGKPVQDAERAILGFDHAAIAAILCEAWHLPRAIAFGIRHHHRPSTTSGHQLSHIVHLADFTAIQAGMGSGGGSDCPVLDETSRSLLPIDADTLNRIAERAIRYVDSLTRH
jgi:HD-like signal output (HDOD) protein